jgi:hypothetical protein
MGSCRRFAFPDAFLRSSNRSKHRESICREEALGLFGSQPDHKRLIQNTKILKTGAISTITGEVRVPTLLLFTLPVGDRMMVVVYAGLALLLICLMTFLKGEKT